MCVFVCVCSYNYVCALCVFSIMHVCEYCLKLYSVSGMKFLFMRGSKSVAMKKCLLGQ